jgi:nucleoid-associated protein YgaU
VVVGPGDTLWSIAARDLAPGSPDARVAAGWRAIYAANRHRIGPDPDVIVPGARLTLPGKDLP